MPRVPKKIVIIGGGISGLAAAFFLKGLRSKDNLPFEITLLEAKPAFGGVIETVRQSSFLFEGGPDAFISEKPAALELCRKLALENEVIGTRPENQRSYVFLNGRLFRVPEGFYLVAPVRFSTLFELPFISLRGKLRMACEPLIPKKKRAGDESVGHFIRRRFGRETFEKIGQPMMSAMYGGDADKLSLEAAFPRFKGMEEKYGSVVRALRVARKGMGPSEKNASGPRYSLFLTLKSGLGRLPLRLQEEMSGVRMLAGAEVTCVRPGSPWKIQLMDGRNLEADILCMALPGPRLRRILTPFAADLAEAVGAIRYESVVTVNLGFRREDLSELPDGFGVVVPVSEARKVIGCTFSSNKFEGRARENFFSLRLFMGGALEGNLAALSDGLIETLALEELRVILGITAAPVSVSIRRYPESMPQYSVGHLDVIRKIKEIAKRYPNLVLTGNAYEGIGIPDCIRQAGEAAEEIMKLFKTYSEKKSL